MSQTIRLRRQPWPARVQPSDRRAGRLKRRRRPCLLVVASLLAERDFSRPPGALGRAALYSSNWGPADFIAMESVSASPPCQNGYWPHRQGASGVRRARKRRELIRTDRAGWERYAEGLTGRFAMNKTARKPLPPAAPAEDEDPVWGDALAGFFGLRSFT